MFVQFPRKYMAILLATFALFSVLADDKKLSFEEIAEKRYFAAREHYHADPQNVEAAWQFCRASFDWAEFSPNDEHREKLANEGIAAARQLVAKQPRLAQAHYYLAMNLGQLARTKSIGALRIVDEMEREFKLVVELDPLFDFAGADRNLGMLYHEAPGWPASIGSGKKARQHLERALSLAPDFPENHLYLLEAYIKWNDKKAAQRAFDVLQKRWPEMKEKLTDDHWDRDWIEWEKRWRKIQDHFAK